MNEIDDTTATAEYLRASPRTLEDWRCQEKGPPYMKIGGLVRYRKTDVDEWLTARGRRPSADHGIGKVR